MSKKKEPNSTYQSEGSKCPFLRCSEQRYILDYDDKTRTVFKRWNPHPIMAYFCSAIVTHCKHAFELKEEMDLPQCKILWKYCLHYKEKSSC